MSVVKVTMFGDEYNKFVVVYRDKKGNEHRFMTRIGYHLVKNEKLVREFKTLLHEYEETINKAWNLAEKLDMVERQLRQDPVTEEEIVRGFTQVDNS